MKKPFRRHVAYLLSLSLFCSHLAGAHEISEGAKHRGLQPGADAALTEPMALAEIYLRVVGAAEDGIPSETLELDTFSFLNQKVHRLTRVDGGGEKEEVTSLIAWPKVAVKLRPSILDEGRSKVQGAYSIPLGRSLPAGSEGSVCDGGFCGIQIWSTNRSGQMQRLLNEFSVQASRLVTVGHYMIFTTADHFNAEAETATISVIDSKMHQASLGNERIPIYRIPLRSKAPIRSIQADGPRLLVNGVVAATQTQLNTISRLFTMSVNLTANLLNPATVAGAQTIYAGLDSIVAREMKSVSEEATSTTLDADLVGQAISQYMEQVVKQHERQKSREQELKPAHLADAQELLERHAEQLTEEGRKISAAFAQGLQTSAEFKQALNSSRKQFLLGRKILPRLRLWEGFLTKPAPHAGENIARAIGELSMYWLRGAGDVAGLVGRLVGTSDGRPTKRSAAFLTSVLSAWGLSGYMPDSYYQFLAGALEAGQTMAGYAGHVLYGLGDAGWTSTKAIVSAVNPMAQYTQYIDPSTGAWYKTAVGVTIFMGYLAAGLGAWHIVMRVKDLVRDMRQPGYQGIVKRQQDIERAFAADLAKGEAHRHAKGLTAEDEAKLIADFEAVRAQRQREESEERTQRSQWIRRLYQAPLRLFGFGRSSSVKESLVKELAPSASTFDSVEKVAAIAGEQADAVVATTASLASVPLLGDGEGESSHHEYSTVNTRFQAIMHLLKSTASYRFTVGEYTTGFNFYASIRYSMFGWFGLPLVGRQIERATGQMVPTIVLPKPFSLGARLVLPRFFKTAVTTNPDKITMPTVLNGGMTPVTTSLARVLDTVLSEASPEQIRADLAEAESFEKQVIGVEETLWQESAKSAFAALTHFIDKDDELARLYLTGNGFATVTAADIRKLHLRNKLFVRTYLDLVYNQAMGELLKESLAQQNGAVEGVLAKARREFGADAAIMQRLEAIAQYPEGSDDTAEFVTNKELRQLKDTLIAASQGNGTPLKLDFTSEQIAAKVAAITQGPEIFARAKAEALRLLPSLASVGRHVKYEVATNYDPQQNGSMRRFDIVQRQKRDPVAMARATRNEISSLFRTLPVDITFKFLLLAGITEGIAKPIQEHFFGSNSIGYLSQFEFYGGLMAGILFSSLSSAWGKLQQDYADQQAGLFGQIPTNDDAKRSFWSLYFKNWRLKKNSFWRYYKEWSSIIFWNFPAALPQIFLLDLIFLGRFDLDGFILGYLTTFLLPVSALVYKSDQIFEQTSFWSARGLKQDALKVPEVQIWLNEQMQSLRNKFNLRRDLVINPLMAIFGNTFLTKTASQGPFAVWRYIANGFTPTELIVYKMRALEKLAEGTSVENVTKSVLRSCEKLLTNGNPGLVKLPPK